MPYHIARIDVHKKMLAVAVANVEVEGEFLFERLEVGTSLAELRALADWLVARGGRGSRHGIDGAVLATGVGSAGAVLDAEAPDERARHPNVRHAPSRASAVESRGRRQEERLSRRRTLSEAAGCPELTLSFVPDAEQRLWRTVMRRKYQITRNRVQLHNRLEALLEEAHIKLSSLVSDLLGTSARRMLQALADGETDPATLAALAAPRLRATAQQLCDLHWVSDAESRLPSAPEARVGRTAIDRGSPRPARSPGGPAPRRPS
jgi:hypothetical protein